MAIFTELDDQAIRGISASFALGKPHWWEVIAAGTVNSNFSVTTERGRYFLRINEGKLEPAVRYEAGLVAALVAAGVPTPPPLAAVDGEPFAVYDGKFVSCFPWVQGEHRCTATVAQADVFSVGRALALLHRAGEPLAAAFANSGIYTHRHMVQRFRGLRHRTDSELGEALAALAQELDWLDVHAATRAGASCGVIHGDLFRDNVLLTDSGEISALIDFEQACTGSLAYDLAVCLNAWCYHDRFRPELVASLVAGYQAERALTSADRAALYVECRAAAARFTVTRITDVHLADTVSTKDFRRYLARLRAWQALGPEGLAQWITR